MSLPVITDTDGDDLSYDFKGWHGRLSSATVPVGTFFLRCKRGAQVIAVRHSMTYEDVLKFDPDKYWNER